MRILVFSWRDPRHPLAGGAEQVMHEHMKGWIAAGHKVTLFSSRFNNSSEEEVIDNVKIIRKGYQYWGVQFAAFFYYLKNKENYDLVVDQFHGLPFFTPLYVGKPKLAVIQETAGKVWLLNPLPWPLNLIVGIIGYLGEPLLFIPYRNTSFMTGSESAKEGVAKFGIPLKNIAVVPHGVMVTRPVTDFKKEKQQTIVFLGVLSKDKGIEDALRCFSKLSQKGNFQFWVIGKPDTADYGKRIEKMAKDLDLEGKVKFWGFVSQEKKFELLARAHLLINPSVREGWGLVNIEANSMGIPVVAYSSPGLVDSVKDGLSGILCTDNTDNTPEVLAENVLRVLSCDDLYNKLQEGAIKWSSNFTWKASVNQSLTLIEKLR